MHDNTNFTCCCTKSDCKRLQEFNESFKRVECDARLAAEIGQVLLQEKNGELQYDLFKDNYHELKQLRWENEQSNEMINLLKSEIKLITANSNGMKKTIDCYEKELQKKKLCEKLLSVKTDIEEELKTQISDLKQELCQLRKSENNMIIKYKRLNSNHETLQLTHEALSQEHDNLLVSLSNKENKIVEQQIRVLNSGSEKIPVINNTCSENVIPEAIPNKVKERRQEKNIPQFRMTITNSNKNPFDVLHSVTQQTFDKISATDTRVLNRRLRRVFDMSELSDMSNSIISGILIDLSEFKNQFEWVHDYDQDPNTEYFFPLVLSIQDLLKEVGTMKMTLNDLQADYVKRIERLTSVQHQQPVSYHQQLHLQQKHHQQRQQHNSSSIKLEQPNNNTNNDNHDNKRTFMQGLLSLFTLH